MLARGIFYFFWLHQGLAGSISTPPWNTLTGHSFGTRFRSGVNPKTFSRPTASWHVTEMEGEWLGLESGRPAFERQFCYLHSSASHYTSLGPSVHTNIKSGNNINYTEFYEESEETMHVKTACKLFRGICTCRCYYCRDCGRE